MAGKRRRDLRPSPAIDRTAASLADRVESGPRWYADRAGWGLVGAGVLGTGAAALLRWTASSLRAEAITSQSEGRRIELRETADRSSLLGGAVGVVGAGALVAGAIKLAIHSRSRPHARPSAAAWDLVVSPRRIAVRGQF